MRGSARSHYAALLGGVAGFLLLNELIFGTGLYKRVLSPNSAAGAFTGTLARAEREADHVPKRVLVLGDSRIFRGLVTPAAERAAVGMRFINAGIPGTTPRCWFVFDRALDPNADRFSAVVIPVDTYSDDDGAIGSVDGNDHAADLHPIVFTTSLPDIVRVAASFSTIDARVDALFELLVRGPLLREDVEAFAVDPSARLASLRTAAAANVPQTEAGSLTGLRADFEHDTLTVPATYPPAARGELERQVLHRAAPSPSYARYREDWLAPIVARYRQRGVPVIFVRIPTRPLHRAMPLPVSGSLLRISQQNGAVLLDQGVPLSLERPEFFADADHLNAEGAHRFSTWLGRNVAAAIAGKTMSLAMPGQPRVSSHAAWLEHPGVSAKPATAAAGFWAQLSATIISTLAIGVPMRFASYEFLIFFAIVASIYYLVRHSGARRAILLLASWYFYARWNAWYLAVLLALTLTDYLFGLAIERVTTGRRRVFLIAGIVVNLAFLGTAKYADFLTASIATLVGMRGDAWALHVLVPIGISFHTFQSISYLVDVSRDRIRAMRNLGDYALYLAFFPQLLAGPIVRAGRFVAEWTRRRRRPAIVGRDLYAGTTQVAIGLFKKTAFADRFAAIADSYFADVPSHPGTLAAITAIVAFAFAIYFDFSGYSDIAIGLARVLGFRFPQNFRRPYLAWSISEFWRRWHMTLSSWLRDYVYIPLGGNRDGAARTIRNLMLTMLLGGLWHGANWTFVAWGAFHGALLSIERITGFATYTQRRRTHLATRLTATIATFVLVCVGWTLFRAPTFAAAGNVFANVFSGASSASVIEWPLAIVATGFFALEITVEVRGRRPWRIGTPLRAGALTMIFLALELGAYPGAPAQFIYFRF